MASKACKLWSRWSERKKDRMRSRYLPLKLYVKRPTSESIQVPSPKYPPPPSWSSTTAKDQCSIQEPVRDRTVNGVSYTNHNTLWFPYDCRSLTDPPGCSVGLSSDWLVSGFQLCLLSYSRRHHVQWGRSGKTSICQDAIYPPCFPSAKATGNIWDDAWGWESTPFLTPIHLHYGDIHLTAIFPMTYSI